MKKTYFSFFGYTAFNVVTGSMSPELEIGDIIVVKIGDDIAVNDVITYYKDNNFITHRVIEKNGETLITKGDSNNSVDTPIAKSMLIGRVVHVFSNAGTIIEVLLTPKVFVPIVITLLLFSMCISYIPKKKVKPQGKFDKNGIEILEIEEVFK